MNVFILFVAAGELLSAEYEGNTRQGQVKLKIMEELQTGTTFRFRGSLQSVNQPLLKSCNLQSTDSTPTPTPLPRPPSISSLVLNEQPF